MLFFCFVFVTLFLRICAQESNFNMTNVPGPQTTCPEHRPMLFFVALNENHCYLTDKRVTMEAFVNRNGTCLAPSDCKKRYFEYCLQFKTIHQLIFKERFEDDCPSVIVPEYYRSNLQKMFKNKVFRSDNFTVTNCKFRYNAYFDSKKTFCFYYRGQPNPNNTQQTTQFVEQSSSTTENTLDLYLYIGAGVAVFIVIVIAQTFCIVRYRKRVSNTKRTLDVDLCNQEEKMNDKSVRYSTGPELRRMVKNTKTNKNNEEEIYASIESLENDIDPRPVCKEPQILKSSPKEMPDGYLEPITVKQSQNSQTRPKLPLPHDLGPSGLDVREMPQMTSPSGVSQLRAKPPPITPKPRLPHALQTSFQPRPVLPRNFQPNFTPAVNVPRHRFAPTSYKHPTTDPRLQPLPPPPMSSTTSSALDTSDEEWTYEILPPFEAYLH